MKKVKSSQEKESEEIKRKYQEVKEGNLAANLHKEVKSMSEEEFCYISVIKEKYINRLEKLRGTSLVESFYLERAISILEKEKSVTKILEIRNLHLLTPRNFVKAIYDLLTNNYHEHNYSERNRILQKRLRLLREFKESINSRR